MFRKNYLTLSMMLFGYPTMVFAAQSSLEDSATTTVKQPKLLSINWYFVPTANADAIKELIRIPKDQQEAYAMHKALIDGKSEFDQSRREGNDICRLTNIALWADKKAKSKWGVLPSQPTSTLRRLSLPTIKKCT